MDEEIKTMEEYIDSINPKWKNPSKDQLWDFVKLSLIQIKEINEKYNEFFISSEGEQSSIINDIENKISILLEEYKKLNEDLETETNKTKLTLLNEQVAFIKNYHKELLEWEDSIKSDIEDSQNKINKFYNYLFDENYNQENDENLSDAEENHNSWKIRKIIKEIIEFYNNFNPSEEDKIWYAKAIESFYSEFFASIEWKKSKIDEVKDSINQINTFRIKDLENIKSEIKIAKQNADDLLWAATWGSLVEGYLNSKREYQDIPEYEKMIYVEFDKTNIKKSIFQLFWIVIVNIWNIFANSVLFLKSVFSISVNYVLFITPLIILVLIFVKPDAIQNIVWTGDLSTSIKDLTFFNRLLISLPFWWIAWFWQHSISQKRKLAEEYNHKAQVVKMYLNFTTNSKSYPIDNNTKKELNDELLKIIARRPWEIYWKDETIIDKIVKIFSSSKLLADDLKNNIKGDTTNQ